MTARPSQDHVIAFCLLLVALASGLDLLADLRQGVNTGHLLQETVILVMALAGACWLVLNLRMRNRKVGRLEAELRTLKDLHHAQPPEVVAAKRHLAGVMAQQFEAWSLTGSEREVSLLLLKGFSLKEIAGLRGTSEKTIRQQASSVYKKAGLSGRHALSAWFIEDIL